jgi:hypothetical protein
VLGEDHPDTLTSAHGLADDLYGLGEYQQARVLTGIPWPGDAGCWARTTPTP